MRFDELDTVVRKGAEGRQCYIVLTGHVGSVPREGDAAGAATGYGPMQFFGEEAVTNEDPEQRKWSETLVATEETVLATLKRADYMRITGASTVPRSCE